MKDNEYQCAVCGGIFKKGWTDEEAKKEAEKTFGKNPDDWNNEQAIICDDCYNKMHPDDNKELVEEAKKHL